MRAPTLAVLLATAIVAACGQGGDKAEDAGPADSAATAPAPATDAEKQAALAALPAPYNTADLENGRKKYALCRSCHTLNEGGARMTGPNLHDIFGAKAGAGDFTYSEGLKQSGLTWEPASMDPWIANPRAVVPGTRMAFAGVRDAKDRTDLIAYLMVETR